MSSSTKESLKKPFKKHPLQKYRYFFQYTQAVYTVLKKLLLKALRGVPRYVRLARNPKQKQNATENKNKTNLKYHGRVNIFSVLPRRT